MAGVDKKIAATAFTARTGLDMEQLAQIADTAAANVSRKFTKVVRVNTADWTLTYEVQRGGGIAVLGDCHLQLARDEHSNIVSFFPGDYVTVQSTFLFVIPTWKKESGALKPFQAFSAHLRGALGA